jgi:ABC-type transporter Mla MlaB component
MPSIDAGFDEHTLVVDGDIRFENVVDICERGIVLMKTLKSPVMINCGGLINCDSSSLALCTAWVRAAVAQKKKIVFVHIPSFMQDLIRVHGLDTLLPTG